MTNTSKQDTSAVFYADVLGLSALATASTGSAADVLSRLAQLMSQSGLEKYLQHPAWSARYGLSDSILLLANSVDEAVEAAAELMLNVAYLTRVDPILLRGAIAWGQTVETNPLFSESATKNIVGPAVVEAVSAEGSKKGPRITVTPSALGEISDEMRAKWLVGDDLLWPLAAYPESDDGETLQEIIHAAIMWAYSTNRDQDVWPHAQSYLELMAGTAFRLKKEGRWVPYSPTPEVAAACDKLVEVAPAVGPLLWMFFS